MFNIFFSLAIVCMSPPIEPEGTASRPLIDIDFYPSPNTCGTVAHLHCPPGITYTFQIPPKGKGSLGAG